MVNYELALYIINFFFYGIFLIMLGLSWYYVAGFFTSMKRIKKAPHSDKLTKFAVLVPARNEGHVIGNIMKALKAQTYNPDYFDVWFIVESEDDPTIKQAQEYGYNHFVRDELTDKRKTKGFAIQECIRYFKNNNIHYDAYMIFDADNVMDEDYLEQMNNLRQTGVEVGVGYRNFTNINTNWLTAGSAILFTYINSFTGKNRTIFFKKAVLCGTGYYINSDIIDEAGGWIFTGMTEDSELTVYCEYHNINMCYYPLINFYDEQSPSYRTNHAQHIRWIWGFFIDRRKFKKGGKMHSATSKALHRAALFDFNVSMIPLIVCVVADFLVLIPAVVLMAISIYQKSEYMVPMIQTTAIAAGFLYFIMMVAGAATIIHNFNRLKLKWWMIIVAIVTYPLYWVDIILAALHGLFVPRRRKTWTPIKHSGKIDNKKAKKACDYDSK